MQTAVLQHALPHMPAIWWTTWRFRNNVTAQLTTSNKNYLDLARKQMEDPSTKPSFYILRLRK